MLRFPEGMRDHIAEEAKKNGRSMNAEIVARLAASFEATLTPDLDTVQKLVAFWKVHGETLERLAEDFSAPKVPSSRK